MPSFEIYNVITQATTIGGVSMRHAVCRTSVHPNRAPCKLKKVCPLLTNAKKAPYNGASEQHIAPSQVVENTEDSTMCTAANASVLRDPYEEHTYAFSPRYVPAPRPIFLYHLKKEGFWHPNRDLHVSK
ncbi:uncharacterized protein [Dermacentor albipictus]|uniref:uncharacterized protein n=1 Tax=Dermacentor albipictus TaxID=60249 RepID=UPI0038FD0462